MTDPTAKELEVINTIQCPGCACGVNTTECDSFKFEREEGFYSCDNHCPGTMISGIGTIFLGLPHGFNHTIKMEVSYGKVVRLPYIRLWNEMPSQTWNRLNIPLWALEKDGFLYVKTACPRKCIYVVDVIVNGKVADMPIPPVDNIESWWSEIE